MNRRQFLTGDWSEASKQSLVEYGSELAVATALVSKSYEASFEQRVMYTPGSEGFLFDNPEYTNAFRTLEEQLGVLEGAVDSLTQLGEVWRDKFSYTKVTPVTNCDSDGKCSTTLKTETVWREPREYKLAGIDHVSIQRQLDFYEVPQRITKYAVNSALNVFDFSNGGNKIFFSPSYANTDNRKLLSALAYSSIGLGYAYYEELASRILENNYNESLDKKGIYRRAFLKFGGGALGVFIISRLSRHFSTNSQNLHGELSRKRGQLAAAYNLSPEEQVIQLFGSAGSPRNVLANGDRLVNVLNSNLPDKQGVLDYVRRAGIKISRVNSLYRDRYGQDGSSLDSSLGTACAAVWATRELNNYASGQNTLLATDHLLTAGAVALALAGYAVTSEGLIAATDDIAENLK